MTRTPACRIPAAPVLVWLALAAGLSSGPAMAQQLDITEEDKPKIAALQSFLDNLDDRLPTIDRIDAARLPVTFPFREVQDHVVVDVAFGDKDPVPFMFDTGAPTLVTPELARAHGGEVLVEQLSIAGGGKLVWYPVIQFPSLTVGESLEIADATGQVGWSGTGSFHCITQHGLFGAPAMRNAVWQIDYGAKRITVAASADQLDHVDGAISVPFTYKENALSPSPVVELGVGSGTLTFIVDTGGGIPMTINTADLATVGLEVPGDAPTSAAIAGGAAGAFESTFSGMTLPIRFGDTELETTVIVGDGMAPTTQGNIGHAFLKNFVVTFDWPNRMIHLDPLADDGSIPPIGDAASAGLAHDGEKVFVSAIARGGPADAAGLELGETVTHVDGRNIRGISQDDYCAIAETEPKTITTESGTTYDAAPIEGFFGGRP
jgi:hypothetical protein